MSRFHITFAEPAWPDLGVAEVGLVVAGTVLIGGMSSGKSSVALRMATPGDGPDLVGQCSLDHLEAFVRACRGREQFVAEQLEKHGGQT